MQFIPYPDWLKPEIIPNLPIRWYGMMYLVAFVITYFLFMRQVKQRKLNISSDLAINFFFWTIIGVLIGARIFATTIYDTKHTFLHEPWLIFWPFDKDWNFTGLQGMSFHGGVVGAVTAVIIFCRVKKIDFLEWGDMMVHAIPLGYTFGRLGNFINGELYGKVSDAPWAMLFPDARRIDATKDWVTDFIARTGFSISDGASLVNLPRHPSQLYEALLEGLILWLIMWFIVRPRRPFKGFSISMYMIGYSVFRFFIEYVREPDDGLDYVIMLGPKNNPPELFMSFLNFSTGQVLSALMVLGGLIAMFFFYRHSKTRAKAEYFDTSISNKTEKDWGAPRIQTPEEIEKKKQRRKIHKKLR